MKFNKMAQLARESADPATSGDVELVDIPAVDIGEALSKDAETQVTEMQAEIIEGDQEIIEATSDILEGTDGIAGAPDDLKAAAETIRVLGNRYGVTTMRVSKESIAAGVGVASLRKDASKVKAQIALAKEAVGNRIISGIKNGFDRLTGKFSVTEKAFDALITKAAELGNSQASDAKFENGQVIDGITDGSGSLVGDGALKALAKAQTASIAAATASFSAFAATAKATEPEKLTFPFGNLFSGLAKVDGKISLTNGVFIGGKSIVLAGNFTNAKGADQVFDNFDTFSLEVVDAAKTKAGSEGLPALPAKEVHKRLMSLKSFFDAFEEAHTKVEDEWFDAIVKGNDTVKVKSEFSWLGWLFAGIFYAIYKANKDNKANNTATIGGRSLNSADASLNKFFEAVGEGIYKQNTAVWSLVSNLMNYYSWCLKNQASVAPATESLDESTDGVSVEVDVNVPGDLTQDNGETGGLVDTMVQADLNTVQDVGEAAEAADGVSEEEAAQVEQTLNAVAERRGVQRVKIAREGYSEKRIKANVVAATALVAKNLKAKKSGTASA